MAVESPPANNPPESARPPKTDTKVLLAIGVAVLAFAGTVLSSWMSFRSTQATNDTQKQLIEFQLAEEGAQERVALRSEAYEGFVQGIANFETALGQLIALPPPEILSSDPALEALRGRIFDDFVNAPAEIARGAIQLRLVGSEQVAHSGAAMYLAYVKLLAGASGGNEVLFEEGAEERCASWQEFVIQARSDLEVEALPSSLENDPICTPVPEAVFGAFTAVPAVDDLAHECMAGDDPACDAAFLTSPFGSEAELIGATCGGRRFDTTANELCSGYDRSTTAASRPGDDPFLDNLLLLCEAGYIPGCEVLRDFAPIGTTYADLAHQRIEKLSSGSTS